MLFRSSQTWKQVPAFKGSKPLGSIGYLNELELGAMYGEWKAGKIKDADVVAQITSKVADARYTLKRPVQDQNADGRLTHRDAYLQDYNPYVAPRLDPQSSIDGHTSPTDSKQPDRPLLASLLASFERSAAPRHDGC